MARNNIDREQSTAMSMDELTAAIHERIGAMPAQLAAGARFILDHPDVVVSSSMRDIAMSIGVAPATLVRLARALDFQDWSSLREIYVAAYRGTPGLYARGASALVEAGSGESLLARMADTLAAHTTRLGFINDAATFDAAVRRLAEAPRIYVAAFLSCRAPGLTFTYISRLFRDGVHLSEASGSSLVTELATLDEKDVVLSINFSPYSRDSLLVAGAVKRSGAGLISLADSRVTPLTDVAEHVLLFETASPSFFPTIAAATALVEALTAGMMRHLGVKATEHLTRVEQSLYAADTYVAANARSSSPGPGAVPASKSSPPPTTGNNS
ncbi:MurR/RpiR family transcriptional regulator [Aquamicrobium defluvii]|uniref:DNA-binding protein n=1 Tax=Aquamicrobium defluvii TaxID=69279 RepID=A0A011TRQ8_9HYPH|nr:MurR/RpiR family transcriptional regulator [Aquamicrobium defluvii]EXL06792.1 DNA-binding protein [Aquamicrobium defluvii]TDR35898.1 RpiR family transcriptional regulator [Aquamicrobium defluvii]